MLKIIYNKKINKFILPVLISAAVLMLIFTGCEKHSSDKLYVDTKENSSAPMEADGEGSEEFTHTGEKEPEEIQTAAEDGYIYVQVCGAVNNPGVYRVKNTLRVFEVIDVAGGVTEEADTNVINMARPVLDEMKIYIPARDEVSAGNYDNADMQRKDVSAGYDLYSDESEDNDSEEEDALVNINRASMEELMTLPGIGEAKAGAIIEYREENGAFTDISEIMNISGIKQAAFEKIKDLIKV